MSLHPTVQSGGAAGGGRTVAGAAGAGAAPIWAVGSLCMAKYAADGKFYPAQVTEVGPKGVKVSFTEYENEFQVCAPKDLRARRGGR